MVSPLLSLQAKEASRWTFITKGVREGFSPTALYEACKNTELGLRKIDFLALVRQARGITESGFQFGRLKLSERLDIGRMGDARYPIGAKFQWSVKYVTYNPSANETMERWVNIISDDNLTKREVLDEAYERLMDHLKDSDESVLTEVATSVIKERGVT